MLFALNQNELLQIESIDPPTRSDVRGLLAARDARVGNLAENSTPKREMASHRIVSHADVYTPLFVHYMYDVFTRLRPDTFVSARQLRLGLASRTCCTKSCLTGSCGPIVQAPLPCSCISSPRLRCLGTGRKPGDAIHMHALHDSVQHPRRVAGHETRKSSAPP